jgi:hypothetical protein
MGLLLALLTLVLVTVLDYLAQQKQGILAYAGDDTTPATAPDQFILFTLRTRRHFKG